MFNIFYSIECMEYVGHETNMNSVLQSLTEQNSCWSILRIFFVCLIGLFKIKLYILICAGWVWTSCYFFVACLLFPRLTCQPWSFGRAMAFKLYSCGLWNTCLWAQSDLELNTKIPPHGTAVYSTCQVGRRIDLWGTVTKAGSQDMKEVSNPDSC